MIIAGPDADKILCNSRTTTGTLITIPAGNTWTGDLVISASVAAAATGTPSITTSGVGGGPASGTVVHRLSITGLAVTTATDSCMTEIIVVAGANDITLEFNTGGATSAAATATGFLL